MTQKPIRSEDEKLGAYMLRLLDWEALNRKEAMAQFRSIDSAMTKCKVSVRPATTKQTEIDRMTLHDKAATNPALKRILKRMQLSGTTL